MVRVREKKQLGAFYTPAVVADTLVQWALRSPRDLVLEPSFGGCGFVIAALARLELLGSSAPQKQVFGSDVDLAAFSYLPGQRRNFLLADFTCIRPSDFSTSRFDAVIGNPPYIAYHRLPDKQRQRLKALLAEGGVGKVGHASMWAAFVVHALSFLRQEGRFAWVLPGAVLHSEYGRAVAETIARSFAATVLVHVQERLFLAEGTDESSVIMLAEGYGRASPEGGSPVVTEVRSAAELAVFASRWPRLPTTPLPCILGSRMAGLTSAARAAFGACERSGLARPIESIASVKIGTVTGSNAFFILQPSSAKKLRIPVNSLKPIVSKFSHLEGIEFTADDHVRNVNRDLKCLVLSAEDAVERVSGLRPYLASFPRAERRRNKTFRKRKIWHAADDGRRPDAFLSYMQHDGPRIVLNETNSNSTNTIHRLYYLDNLCAVDRKLAAVSVLSSFSQLSAELCGRSYGSGVLKLEPSEAKRVKILLPRLPARTVEEIFSVVDAALRRGESAYASELVDQLVLTAVFGGDAPNMAAVLQAELRTIRARRRGKGIPAHRLEASQDEVAL